MGAGLTPEGVAALAPEAKVAAAGKKLGAPKSWRNLGCLPEAIWGECRGSAIYQVRVDLSDPAVKCSCPSRKQPCKHTIGLLFLSFEAQPAEASSPGWVTDWLARRAFSDFEPAERRAMGEKVRTLGGGGETGPEQGDSAAGDLDHRRASRTLPVLARILGVEHHG